MCLIQAFQRLSKAKIASGNRYKLALTFNS